MDFHRIPAEFLRDMIVKGLIEKGIVKEEYTFDNIDDDNENTDNTESNTDIVEKPKKEKKEKKKKEKKEKKEKKDKSDKPSKPASSFVFFKSHPDNTSSIEEAAQEINEDTGKPYGKVKGAGIVWGKMTDEEKKVWADKSLEDFNSKNQEMEIAS